MRLPRARHGLRARGELQEAIAILAQVHATVPHLGFGRWLASWLEEAAATNLRIEGGALVPALALAVLVRHRRARRRCPPSARAAEEIAVIGQLAMRMSDHPSVALLTSAALRRAGRFEDALVAAERVRSEPPNEQYLIMKGHAERGLRDFDGALATFELAHRTTSDPTFLMEKMRVLADAGRWSDAIAGVGTRMRASARRTWKTRRSSQPSSAP